MLGGKQKKREAGGFFRLSVHVELDHLWGRPVCPSQEKNFQRQAPDRYRDQVNRGTVTALERRSKFITRTQKDHTNGLTDFGMAVAYKDQSKKPKGRIKRGRRPKGERERSHLKSS